MDTFNTVLELLNKGGTIGILVGVGIAVWKKELVIGWMYREKEEELETCRIVANAYATKTEAKLERLEQQLELNRTDRELPPPAKGGSNVPS